MSCCVSPRPPYRSSFQGSPPYPLCALPEVQVRHEQPGGPAVLWREPLTVPLERDQIVREVQIGERQVGGEPLLGTHETVLRIGLYSRAFQQELYRHALKRVVESAPPRDALDIAVHGLARQLQQLVVSQGEWS